MKLLSVGETAQLHSAVRLCGSVASWGETAPLTAPQFLALNRLSPTGSFRAYIFWTLSEARSRLYRSQIESSFEIYILKALDEIYISSFAPL